MLELRNISKIYQTKTRSVAALDGVSFTLPEKGLVFILGRSGSGKTTMLNMLGGLDAPSEGELLVDGVSSRDFKQTDFDNYRNRYVGFVFQEYHLLNDYTVADNIALALELQGDLTQEERQQKIAAALSQVDLAGYGDRNTGELSGGQKQRVAIARALVKDPPMILADEPTGALDRKTGRQLFDLLKEISKDKLVVVVSHDEDFAHEYADRILELEEGKIISDTAPIESQTAQKEQAVFPSQKLSIRVASRLGWDSLKKRKLAFSFVAILCTAAFLFVGAADMLACYNKKTVLLKSLAEQKPKYLAVTKEYYNTYDFTTTSPMLSTQEALDWYQTSGPHASGGTAGWYSGYMLNDADIADLEDRTGSTVKGVYVPPMSVMKLVDNYMGKGIGTRSNPQYIQELRGFMELDADTMDVFGFSLLAGALPDGAKDEIVVSKAVYDSFQALGYRGYGYKIVFDYHKMIDGEKVYFEEVIPYNDFLTDSVAAMDAARQRIAEKGGIRSKDDNIFDVKKDSGKTEFAEITQMSDLIGKSIFIESREYTITGIIDTKLAPDLDKEELTHESQWGLAALAFVGPGRVEEIAARYPAAVTLQDFIFTISNEVDDISWHKFVRASDLNADYCSLPISKTKMYLHAGTTANPDFNFGPSPGNLYNQIFQNQQLKEKYQLTVQWTSSTVSYNDSNWTMNDIEYTQVGANLYHLDSHAASGHKLSLDNIELFTLHDVIILDDYYFDLFTEGRAGRYTYAVVSSTATSASVVSIAKGCLQEEDSARYRFEDLTAYQLDKLDETLRAFGELFRLVGIGMVLFATGLFAAFIATGLHGKKQQIGIMRAMGAGSRDVFAIFFTEGLLVAAISAVLATALTAVIAIVGSALLRNLFDLRLTLLNFSVRQAAMIFALSFGIAIVASIIPILRIARQKPVDAIRKS